MNTVLRIGFAAEGAITGYLLFSCFQQDVGISILWCPILVVLGIVAAWGLQDAAESHLQEIFMLLLGILLMYPLAKLLQWAIVFIIAVVQWCITVISFFA